MIDSHAFEGAGPDFVFQDWLNRGEFRIQKCGDCGAHLFHPRNLCTACGGHHLSFVAARGSGVVYSTTVERRRAERGGPRAIALINLAEGPRLLTEIVDVDPDNVTIGMAVETKIVDRDGVGVLYFSPAEAS